MQVGQGESENNQRFERSAAHATASAAGAVPNARTAAARRCRGEFRRIEARASDCEAESQRTAHAVAIERRRLVRQGSNRRPLVGTAARSHETQQSTNHRVLKK